MLDALNTEARSLGLPPIIDRTLEDWFHEDLFERPIEKGLGGGGSEWDYPPAALRAGLEVVRLKASNLNRRNTVLRIRLWLQDFHVPTYRIAADLKSEFGRLVRRHFFRNPFHHDVYSGDDLSEGEKEAERRRAGALDPTFVAARFELPRDDLLRLSWESVSDPAGPSQFLKTISRIASPFLSEKGQAFFGDLLKSTGPYINVSGVFGDPDDIGKSGLEALSVITGPDLTKGRHLYQLALAMFDCMDRVVEFLPPDLTTAGEAFSKTARTLRDSDEWCVAGLAVCTIAASRVKSGGSPVKD
jgi:hypothetical protein